MQGLFRQVSQQKSCSLQLSPVCISQNQLPSLSPLQQRLLSLPYPLGPYPPAGLYPPLWAGPPRLLLL